MHNAFINNDSLNDSFYCAIMHNDYLKSVEKKKESNTSLVKGCNAVSKYVSI